VFFHNFRSQLERPPFPGKSHRRTRCHTPMNARHKAYHFAVVERGDLRVVLIDAGVLIVGVVLERVKCGTTGGFVGEGLAEDIQGAGEMPIVIFYEIDILGVAGVQFA